jgi:integrase
MKLTQTSVLVLTVPAGKTEYFEWDEDLKGFGVRVRPTKKVWVIQYRHGTKQRRLTLGDVAKVAADQARKKAKKHLAAVQLDGDPQADKAEARARAAITLGAKVEVYLAEKVKDLRPNTARGLTRYLRHHWKPLYGIPLHQITRADIADRLAEIKVKSGEYAALQARSTLNSFFAWAVGEGLCDANPVVGTNKPEQPDARTRVLSDEELASIWSALPDSDFGRIVKILMLTGQRREEVAGMAWSELDLETCVWTIPPQRAKNNRTNRVPLTHFVLEIIRSTAPRADRDLLFGDGPNPFSGFSLAKRALDQRLAKERGDQPMPPWRLHDLRRTVSTGLSRLHVLPHVVEELLNHKGAHKAGIAGVYNQWEYRDEVSTAMATWAAHVESVVTASPRKVVPFQRQA